jgi:hypothetical protein
MMKAPWSRVKDWWHARRSPKQYIVHVMRADEMIIAHPDTDYTHTCQKCEATVGIYPSTVKLMQEHPNVVLICNHCMGQSMLHPLVPGAEAEIMSSYRRS